MNVVRIRNWFCVMAVFLVMGCSRTAPPKVESGPPIVTIALPKVELVIRYADITGQTDAVQTVLVRSRVSGFITRVAMSDGQFVDGDLSLWGLLLRQGTLLFEIDPVTYEADVKEAEAKVDVAQAKLELARKNEAREKVARDNGVSSPQQFETFVAQTLVAVAELDSAKSSVVKAQQNLGWTKVTAPISGKADRAYLTAGNVVTGGVTQGTVLTTIVSMSPMYVYFDVDDQTVLYYQRLIREGKIARPKEGLALVEVALKDETGYPHKGYIDFVSNRLSPSTGSLQIRGIFPNEDTVMTPGLFVRGRVPLGQPAESVLVPDEAVITDQGQKIVFVVNEKNMVEARTVTPGSMAYGLRAVEGLAPNDRVIIKGFQRVRPDIEVTPEEGTITLKKPMN